MLQFDLAPENLRGAVLAHLVRLVKSSGAHIGTGFLSTPFLCGVLSENGQLGLAYELLNQKTIPSWLYSVLSIYGEISSAWQTGPREFTLDVTISPNTSARVYLPMKEPQQITEGSALLDHREGITGVQPENGSTVVAVGSGTYHFACPVISQ